MTAPKPPTFRLTDDDTDGERRCDLQIFCGDVTGYDYLVTIDEERARDLIAQLTAWLDAPRLEARETAEVVARDGVAVLLRTAFEWGFCCIDDDAPAGQRATVYAADWHTGPDAERNARADYANARGLALCICGAEEDEDEIDDSGDEPLCRKCLVEAQEAFKSQPMRCKDEPCGDTTGGGQ